MAPDKETVMVVKDGVTIEIYKQDLASYKRYGYEEAETPKPKTPEKAKTPEKESAK